MSKQYIDLHKLINMDCHEPYHSGPITLPVKISGKVINITYKSPIISIDRIENVNGLLVPVISIIGQISEDGVIYSYEKKQ